MATATAFFPPREGLTAEDCAEPPLPPRLLLTGPLHCGKSSMLLQLAYNRAVQGDASLYICAPRERVESHPPVRPHGGSSAASSDEDVLRRIQIKCGLTRTGPCEHNPLHHKCHAQAQAAAPLQVRPIDRRAARALVWPSSSRAGAGRWPRQHRGWHISCHSRYVFAPPRPAWK